MADEFRESPWTRRCSNPKCGKAYYQGLDDNSRTTRCPDCRTHNRRGDSRPRMDASTYGESSVGARLTKGFAMNRGR